MYRLSGAGTGPGRVRAGPELIIILTCDALPVTIKKIIIISIMLWPVWVASVSG